MTYEETLEYLNAYTRSTWKLGLERIRELLLKLGDPQKELKFVHVAGTNGKGSTCAMTENILRNAGYHTGFFPSPYIEDFCERIQCSGEKISHEDLVKYTEAVEKAAESMTDQPSTFEIITAIGMLYFRDRNCDIVVLEVGMGGEFDATNVIDAPEVAVICNIGLDHTEYLGDTVQKIAQTKCKIIKPGCAVAMYPNIPEVTCVVQDAAEANMSRIYYAWDELKEYKLSLFGEHQKKNAMTVLAVIHALRDRHWDISEEAVEKGFATASWPARFEILSDGTKDIPKFVLDGGHNPQCAQAMVKAVEEFVPDEKVTFLIGMLADKDYEQVIDIIMPYADSFVTITPDSTRALSANALADTIIKKGGRAVAFDDYEKAMDYAMALGKTVIAFGSLYAAGSIRSLYRLKYNPDLK